MREVSNDGLLRFFGPWKGDDSCLPDPPGTSRVFARLIILGPHDQRNGLHGEIQILPRHGQ
jgi:hypothetical protein